MFVEHLKFGSKNQCMEKNMGIERSTFLFDENLMLIHLWKKVKVKNHVQEIFDYISISLKKIL